MNFPFVVFQFYLFIERVFFPPFEGAYSSFVVPANKTVSQHSMEAELAKTNVAVHCTLR
jgi:hypothetical protein